MDKEAVCNVVRANAGRIGPHALYKPTQQTYCVIGACLHETGVPDELMVELAAPGEVLIPVSSLTDEVQEQIPDSYTREPVFDHHPDEPFVKGSAIMEIVYGMTKDEWHRLISVNDGDGPYSEFGQNAEDRVLNFLECEGDLADG